MVKSIFLTFIFVLGNVVMPNAWGDIGQSEVPTDVIPPQTTQVFGWVEEVMLDPERRWKIEAKLDSGAETSSLDATNVRRVKAGGKSYVRFNVIHPETGKSVSLRQPYVRTVRIREHDGDHERRRVVLMTVCLGNQERTIEVTLTDRKHFDYPLLIGRSALSGLALIDSRKKHVQEPSCWFGESVDIDELEDHEEMDTLAKTHD